MASFKAPRKNSKTNCCVVGCNNTYINCPAGTKFYSFPNRAYFPGRKDEWISAIRRVGLAGKPWQPTQNSRVCSQHFVGGSKSDHPNDPAFLPTLMPKLYKKTSQPKEEDKDRFERHIRRSEQKRRPIATCDVPTEMDVDIGFAIETKDVSVQCEPFTTFKDESTVILFCEREDRCVGVQTDIYLSKANLPIHRFEVPLRKNVMCGPDIPVTSFEGFKCIKDNDELRGLCGVTLEVFAFLLSFLIKKSSKLSHENRLMLFLVKLKLGLSFAAMGVLFGVHRTTASKHFLMILEELVSKCANIVYWPSKFAIRTLLPESFQNYPNFRASIDCTELRCERPAEVHQQVLFYSNYKSTYTVKFLIGITPNGFISFISKGYGGRATDTYITSNCGFLDLLESGDTVMADKGFPHIKSDFENKTVELIMPPFAKPGVPQFTKEEVDETYSIASVRIHVERVIGRVRTYRILDKVTIDILPYVDCIMRMCCILVNLQQPILKTNA